MAHGGPITAVLAGVLALATAGSETAASPRPWMPPRASNGRPDLTGVWTNASITQLTRPPGVKLAVSKPEADKLARDNPFMKLIESEEGPSKIDDNLLKDENSDRGYNAFWLDPGRSLANVKGEFRTSWIVEPASGQAPFSEAGRQMQAKARAERTAHLYAGPEYLPLPERCLIGFSGAGGPGMLNTIYNNNYQIVQTPDAIVIDVEMVHDARVIPLYAGRAQALAHHKPAAVVQWLGDSVGWWEGDTLVIDTVNVNPQQARQGPVPLSPRGHVTERLSRASQDQIFYEFLVDDPVYYTGTWRAEESLNARKEGVYEYACHEGNYAMAGILGGARRQEAQGIKPSQGPGIFGTPIPEKTKAGGGGE